MKVMLICTSGGHFSTMRALEPFWTKHERLWVTNFHGDTSDLKGKEKVQWLPYQAPRDVLTFLKNLPASFKMVRKERPDLIVSTGASIALNFAIAAKFFGIPFIFVESLSRATQLSLTGKLVYPICDEIYVQWPEISKKYKKAIFAGQV